jgi:hypothetical protein
VLAGDFAAIAAESPRLVRIRRSTSARDACFDYPDNAYIRAPIGMSYESGPRSRADY